MRAHRSAASILVLAVASVACGQATGTQPAKPAQPARPAAEQPAPTLKAGMPAPALAVDEWVKGNSVSGLEKGRVYVVEFWATWCPPCRESIPHLTELQKKHADAVTIIGVAGSERKKDGEPDKRLEKLREFVTKQGDAMAYTIAYDSDREMINTWMKPAGQNGIPCAFIVDRQGTIAWIGNPLDDAFNTELARVVGQGAAPNGTPGAAPKAPAQR